jgi:hypothetical protein
MKLKRIKETFKVERPTGQMGGSMIGESYNEYMQLEIGPT